MTDKGSVQPEPGDTERLRARLDTALARERGSQESRRALAAMLEDLQESQQEIEKARREWTDALDAVQDPIFLHDSEYRVIRANRAYAKCAGMDIRQVIGKPYWQLFPRRDGPLPACAQTMEQGELHQEELRLPSGQVFTTRFYPVRDDEGNFLYSMHLMEDITEKLHAQAELEAKELAYRTLAENLPAMVYRVFVRENNRMQFFNKMGLSMTGYLAEELPTSEICSLVPLILDEDRPGVEAEVRRATANNQPFNVEYRLRHKDGGIRWLLERGTPVSGPDGEPLYIDGVIFDISERKQTESALRLSEEKLSQILEHSSNMFYSHTPEHVLTYVSPQSRQILDCEPEEAMVRWTEFVTENPINSMGFEYTQRAIDTGEPPPVYELELKTRKGRKLWAEVDEAPIVKNGKTIAVVGGLTDITERKQAETELQRTLVALQESEMQFRVMSTAAMDAMLMLDDDGRIVFWNNAATSIFGYTPEEANGQNFHLLLVPARYHEAVLSGWSRFAKTGEGPLLGKMNELEARHKNGTEFPVELSVSAARLGGRWHAIGIMRDITERKRAESELRETRDHLDNLLNYANAPIITWDPSFRITMFNHAFEHLTDRNATDVIGKSIDILFPADRRDEAMGHIQRTETGERWETVEIPILRLDGEVRTVLWNSSTLYSEDGSVLSTIAQGQDITTRKQAEIALQRALRAQRSLSACNAILIHATQEKQLLADMCHAITDQEGYRLAWIGLVEHDEAKTVRPVADAGFEEGYLETLEITWSDSERGQGPTGRAVRLGTPQLAEDIVTDPGYSPWPEEAFQRGYASSIALPLVAEGSGDVFAVLHIYAAEANAFDEAEIRLLQELADEIAFGIQTLRTRLERDHYQLEHLRSADRLKGALTDTIRAIALTVEKRDPYTAGHQTHVADLAGAIAQELGWAPDRIDGLKLGSLIHDIGKIYVPAEILNRPGRLSAPEFEIIKSHPQVGYDIIKDVKFPWPVALMVLQHHERMNGTGYPGGLKSEEIALEARIIAVADVMEAMTAHRPYRPALGIDRALAEIEAGREQLYDAAVVDACLRLFREKGYRLDESMGGRP